MAKPGKKSSKNYEVGYGRPPKHTRFQPGQSGNPRGRPKGQPTTDELFLREAARLVRVKSGDSIVNISKREVVARKLFQKAMEGDMTASRLLLSILDRGDAVRAAEASQGAEVDGELGVPSEEMLRRMLARFDHLRSDDSGGSDAD